MAGPSAFERVVAALFGRGGTEDQADQQLRAELIEMIVETVEPRVRHHTGYQKKLQGCVGATIAYLRDIGKTPLPPLVLSKANWNDDPHLNAYFARSDDVPEFLGRSKDLRKFLADPANAQCDQAFGLLWMKKEEKTVFAPALEGGTVKQEVAQTVINFSEHRLVAPSASEQQSRLEVGRRIIRGLAQLALARIIALDEAAVDFQQQKGYLGTRLRMLQLARDGMEGIVDDPATIDEQIRTVERGLKETTNGYIETKSKLSTLEGYIGQIDEIFSRPEAHLALTQSRVRINRLGFKVDNDSADGPAALTLAELAVGPQKRGVIALVRCPRAEMPPEKDLLANAERYL